MLQKTPFGYTRKDVLLIGLGVTLLGIGLKSGLEVPCFLLLCNHWNTFPLFIYIYIYIERERERNDQIAPV